MKNRIYKTHYKKSFSLKSPFYTCLTRITYMSLKISKIKYTSVFSFSFKIDKRNYYSAEYDKFLTALKSNAKKSEQSRVLKHLRYFINICNLTGYNLSNL